MLTAESFEDEDVVRLVEEHAIEPEHVHHAREGEHLRFIA